MGGTSALVAVVEFVLLEIVVVVVVVMMASFGFVVFVVVVVFTVKDDTFAVVIMFDDAAVDGCAPCSRFCISKSFMRFMLSCIHRINGVYTHCPHNLSVCA